MPCRLTPHLLRRAPEAEERAPIRYELSAAMAIITFDRPEAMNALDQARNEALTRAFERFEREGSARGAVLTSAGDAAFSAGAD
jgi:enoyl-CoA hydratase/carnithine racemase